MELRFLINLLGDTPSQLTELETTNNVLKDIEVVANELKVFNGNGCPPELAGVGRQIARYCGGLPLAVVVIALVLKNLEKKRSLWMEVAEQLNSNISEETLKLKIMKLQKENAKIEVLGCTKSVERSAFQVNVETLGLGNDAFEVIVSSSGSYGKVGKYSISFCSYI
ncbi:late blight resistance homolog R1A-3 isoform X1 [Olea europaea subsp. europaea]|uniref:Late blight resistance homolog R1A-3 isoform X1 n=1 Tax=Olea europaea subsp. europaea TaxID=158383 RepID=A0A8S0TPK8_OLEEU|nr:late blight resistance homolog R1A-3 isoform X1 [Olea europaea subsp. europaea]